MKFLLWLTLNPAMLVQRTQIKVGNQDFSLPFCNRQWIHLFNRSKSWGFQSSASKSIGCNWQQCMRKAVQKIADKLMLEIKQMKAFEGHSNWLWLEKGFGIQSIANNLIGKLLERFGIKLFDNVESGTWVNHLFQQAPVSVVFSLHHHFYSIWAFLFARKHNKNRK